MATSKINRKAGREIASNALPVRENGVHPKGDLMLADIVMRIGSTFLRRAVEARFLKRRVDKKTARDMVQNRPVAHTLASVAAAKIATRSVPGAALVGTGLIAKALYDRGKARRDTRRPEAQRGNGDT